MKKCQESNEDEKSSSQKKLCLLNSDNVNDTTEDEEMLLNNRNTTKIFVSNEMKKKKLLLTCDDFKTKSFHGSWPLVNLNQPINYDKDKSNVSSGYRGTDSETLNNSTKSAKSSLEEDYKTIVKLISNLQSSAKALTTKYEKLISNKNTKQLNFRSHDDIINVTTDSASDDVVKTKKDNNKLFLRTDIKIPDDLSLNFRNKNNADSVSRDSLQFFFENEKLLCDKTNGLTNLKWNDGISVTSPCSTNIESFFDR